MNFNLKDRTIFLVVSGSQAYGFSSPDSDWDYRGVCIPPLDSYIGILDKFEQIVDSDKNKHVYTHFPGLVKPDADMQVMELCKFAGLAAQCNPSVIEILFTDPQHYVICHKIMERMIENRQLFISKSAKARFCGYALSQLKRIKRHKRWLDNPPNHKPTRTEFGLPEQSLLSADQIGAAEALIQREIDDFMIEQDYLPEDVKIELSSGLGRMMRAIWVSLHPDKPYPVGDDQLFESTEDALYWGVAKDQGYSENFLEVLNKEKRYRTALREWQSYQHWLEARNPARAELEKKYGYDCYVEETEFLTESGWKKYDEISSSDRLATVFLNETDRPMDKHPDHLGIEYQHYIDRFEGKFTGELYNLFGNHTDVLVTPNHRVLYRSVERKSGKIGLWKLGEIASMPDTFEVLRFPTPHKKNYQDKHFFDGLPIKPEAYLRLMGWYLSEGCMLFRNGQPKEIRISQKPGGKLDWHMSRWIGKYGGIAKASSYTYTRKPDNVVHHEPFDERVMRAGDKKIVKRILSDCSFKGEKEIPRWVFGLSKYKMNILLDALVLGDGTTHRPDNGIIYYSSSSKLANDVNELALMCGYETSLYGPYEQTTKLGHTKMYQVHINKTREQFKRFTRSKSIKKVPVNDKRIVCFTVPNGTLVTRLNGHVGMHGNSKHATHLVRLIRMAREILEKGEVNVFRHDAEELRAIRAGGWTYEQIVEFAEREDEALNDVVKKSSLPKLPDRHKIQNLLFNMIVDFNRADL